jgi:FOG: TPR repeat, SEL1 subfamily
MAATPVIISAAGTLPVLASRQGTPVNDTTRAMYACGLQYLNGKGKPADFQAAKQLISMAAARQMPEACTVLGEMYFNTKDYTRAAYFLTRAVELGDVNALCKLGLLYHTGKGETRDFNSAYLLYKQAADHYNAEGLYATGWMFYKGTGVKQDYAKAIEYFRTGADMGNPNSYFMLGQCAMMGYGTLQDAKVAKILLQAAAEKGSKGAADLLAKSKPDSLAKHPSRLPSSIEDLKHRGLDGAVMPVMGGSVSADSLQGTWKGKLYVYDWSRTRVEAETGIVLQLKADNGKLSALCYMDGELSSSFVAEPMDKSWIVTSQTPYDSISGTMTLRVLTGKLSQVNKKESLSGTLLWADKESLEPMRPTLFALDKEPQTTAAQDTAFVIRRVYPNPFENKMQADFTVRSADRITFRVIDASGFCYYTYPACDYPVGEHSVVLTPVLPTGSYTLVASGRQFVFNKTVIKK